MAKTQTQPKVVTKTVTGVDALALSKFKQPKGNRDSIAPGEYEINTTVHVLGTVKVGEDYEQANINSLPLMKLVMKLASQVSQDRLVEILLPEALDKISDKEVEDFSERIKGEWEKLAQSVTKPCKGKVTAKLVFVKA